MNKTIYAMVLMFLLFFVIGCQQQSTQNTNIVYTSIYPIQYIVEEIGGDAIKVESVYPPGVDAHSYEPSSREMTKIAEGKSFIYLGAGMESFAETAANALNNQPVELVEIATLDDTLFSESEDHDGHDHGDKDPHVWFDPLKMIQMGEIIKNALSKEFPNSQPTFDENFHVFKDNMIQLDNEFTEILKPKKNKEILVAHAAYGYWEERYGIKQIAISGLSTNDEPSQRDLTRIVKAAKKHELPYVIFEQSGTDKVANIIREHIDAKPLYMHNLESLTDEDIQNNEDYLTLMKHNLKVLDKATK